MAPGGGPSFRPGDETLHVPCGVSLHLLHCKRVGVLPLALSVVFVVLLVALL